MDTAGIYEVLITEKIVFVTDRQNHSIIAKFPISQYLYICTKCGKITKSKGELCRYCSGERKKRAARLIPA